MRFSFQGEDGIRDDLVTGVQTCALPIFLSKTGLAANLLELQYFSAVPYRLGSRAVKFSAKPVFDRKSEVPSRPSDNYLRERMQEQLAREEASFDFMMQFQKDPYAMPIENGLVPWAEEVSPF